MTGSALASAEEKRMFSGLRMNGGEQCWAKRTPDSGRLAL